MTTLVAKRPCVRFKDGVIVGDPPTPAQVRMIAVCDQAARLFGRDVWVTAARNDHETGAHPDGRALDIRTKDWSEGDTVALYDFVSDTLGGDFYLQIEVKADPESSALRGIAVINPQASGPHMHMQVRRGLPDWPPDSPVSTAPRA